MTLARPAHPTSILVRWEAGMKVPGWIGTLTLAALRLGGRATGAPPDEAVEGLATTTRFDHSGAGAWFADHDDCLYTDVQVDANTGSWRYAPGAPNRASAAGVYVYQADSCSGWETLVSGWGWAELARGDFSMTGDLGRARLRKAIDVYDDDHGSLDPRIEVHRAAGTYYLAATGYPDGGFVGNHLQDGFYFLSVTIPW
jgi:hypothetical protein